MARYNQWDIVRSYVAYDQDPSQGKERFVIYLGQLPNGYHRVMYCTSKTLKYFGMYDYYLNDWREENLKMETISRCNKLYDVPSESIKYKLGKLSDLDKHNVLEIVNYLRKKHR